MLFLSSNFYIYNNPDNVHSLKTVILNHAGTVFQRPNELITHVVVFSEVRRGERSEATGSSCRISLLV